MAGLHHLFRPGQVICLEKNVVNPFLLCSPAAQESPAQTSLFGRSPVCEKFTGLYEPLPCGSPRWGQPVSCSNLFPTNLSVRVRPCRLHAGLPAGVAFEADHLLLQSILYVFK